ncbi:hypothetical protein CfE428DRAFT_0805 [Chthoniobacter flavus Ellin428]|uniref:Nucleic acid binding OB-fold tRNA/helicase-type n=1 Tax=Chthoniobacter flavus Ellin428 TaxID=497964 RepID=B4CVW8_9BACT|nr:hypothetical protein [Chthoniobacter flavus]EDY21560.1 hypothetical protein CfE428DRAFT_0805 [Chthoniobacter flavus Ellin428]TCO95503.1 putative nucleic acid binding protein [Chthoniobacter flavus]
MFPSRLLAILSILFLSQVCLMAQVTLTPAEAEAQKCEDRIASVRRDIFGKYDDQLGELLINMEKAADLEGALAVRAERQRLAAEQDLSEASLVSEPKALRALQSQTITRVHDLVSQLIQETMPRLVEFKKQLTMAGKLDEAVNVRTAIERLQNSHLPTTKADASTAVPVETLLLAYGGDRARADKIYKGQKFIVHGVVGGYRPDPADAKTYQVYLSGSTGNGWVVCAFSAPEFHFREEKGAFGALTLVMLNREGDTIARLQKGQTVDVRGRCDGFDDVVRMEKCDQIK